MARRRRASHIEILFETHSTTTDNERWVASGWLDGQLSPLGRRQASELGERRAEEEIVAVFTSDLARRTRAPDPARLAAARVQLRDAQRDSGRPARGRADASCVRPVLRRRELCGRRLARAQLPPGSSAPLHGSARRRDRAFGHEVGARPRPRGDAPRGAGRRLVPLAARLALYAVGLLLTAPAG